MTAQIKRLKTNKQNANKVWCRHVKVTRSEWTSGTFFETQCSVLCLIHIQ